MQMEGGEAEERGLVLNRSGATGAERWREQAPLKRLPLALAFRCRLCCSVQCLRSVLRRCAARSRAWFPWRVMACAPSFWFLVWIFRFFSFVGQRAELLQEGCGHCRTDGLWRCPEKFGRRWEAVKVKGALLLAAGAWPVSCQRVSYVRLMRLCVCRAFFLSALHVLYMCFIWPGVAVFASIHSPHRQRAKPRNQDQTLPLSAAFSTTPRARRDHPGSLTRRASSWSD